MKSTIRVLVAMSALAIAAAVSACSSAFTALSDVFRTARVRAFGFVLGVFEHAAQGQAAVREAVVLILAAKEFLQRIVRRERIEMTPGWRLCPSI